MKAQMIPENIQRDTVVVPANNITDERLESAIPLFFSLSPFNS